MDWAGRLLPLFMLSRRRMLGLWFIDGRCDGLCRIEDEEKIKEMDKDKESKHGRKKDSWVNVEDVEVV